MELSDTISIASFLAAILAALYARWSANAARHQNDIALHGERLRVYRGVLAYVGKIAGQGPSIKENDVWAFDEWVQLSEFYYNKTIYERLDAVFKQSLELLGVNDLWVHEDMAPDEKKELNAKRHSLYTKLRNECLVIREDMKEWLRISQA